MVYWPITLIERNPIIGYYDWQIINLKFEIYLSTYSKITAGRIVLILGLLT